MSFTILEAVTDESVRGKNQLTSLATANASAGTPWLD